MTGKKRLLTMKNTLILTVMFISLFSQKLNSQTEELEKLTQIKSQLKAQKEKIDDSLKMINLLLNKITTESELVESIAITETGTRGKADLKLEPKIESEILTTINKNNLVKVYDYFEPYWFVKRGDLSGYIYEIYLYENPVMKKYKREKSEESFKKKYGDEIASKLMKRMLWVGMTKELAIISQGKPEKINKSQGTYGTREQWVYSSKYLYFDDGLLVSWSN